MSGVGTGGAVHAGPPRSLNVQQFAAARSSEIETLYKALRVHEDDTGTPNLSLKTARHLRRRTTSHNRRIPFRWRHKPGPKKATRTGGPSLKETSSAPAAEKEEASGKRKSQKGNPSRRVRRRVELKGIRDGNGSRMRDGTLRLTTHVWHAKRFAMTQRWGYRLPQGLAGRGRGSRAVFKWARDAAILHDASYIGLIELQGAEDAILQVLCSAVEPPPLIPPASSKSGFEDEEMQGLRYGNAVLYDCGTSHEPIAPVTFLWRPSNRERVAPTGEEKMKERQLWVWVHPSAFDNALEALSMACQQQGQESPQASVVCQSRRGQLARLDLLGFQASDVLWKVIRPVLRNLNNSNELIGHLKRQDESSKSSSLSFPEVKRPLNARLFAKADCLPRAAVLALDVYDPRDTDPSFYQLRGATVSDEVQESIIDGTVLSYSSTPVTNGDTEQHTDAVMQEEEPRPSSEQEDVPPWESLAETGLANEVADSPCLWANNGDRKIAPPLSQNALSNKRHRMRTKFFSHVGMDDDKGRWDGDNVEKTMGLSKTCPIVLLKHMHSSPSVSGWSIIMPVTWVHAFWVPLVLAGGRAIGLRERHWLATDAGIPHYPHDFPECRAGVELLAAEAAEFDNANQRRPPAKRAPPYTVSWLQRSAIQAYGGCSMAGPTSWKGAMSSHGESLGVSGSTSIQLSESANLVDGSAMVGASQATREPSALAKSDEANEAVSNRATAMVATPTLAGLQPAEPEPARGAGVRQATNSINADVVAAGLQKLLDNPVTQVRPPPDGDLLSGNTLEPYRLACDTYESDRHQDDSRRYPSDAAAEASTTDVIEMNMLAGGHRLDLEGAGKKLVRTTIESPHSSTRTATAAAIEIDAEKRPLRFFVARTMDALIRSLKDSNIEYAFVQPPVLKKTTGAIRKGRRGERMEGGHCSYLTVESPVSIDSRKVQALIGGLRKVCYVRVLIAIPSKGVIKENGVLCLPTDEDFDSFVSRSQNWHGVETSWRNRQVGKQIKRKAGAKTILSSTVGSTTSTEAMTGIEGHEDEECGNRESIGCITSIGPRGSSWSGTGICDVGSLLKVRAMQWSDQRWKARGEILVLAGNKSSPMLRPVLVSITLERGPEQHIT